MITTCNNCEEQLNHSLSCIPLQWRDPIVSTLCKLFEERPRHCEIDLNFYLCDLPTKWREELVEMLCYSYTLNSCDMNCSQCKELFINHLPSFPADWREKIIVIICDIIQTKGCNTPPCVTYLITPFVGIDGEYEFTYLDCYRETITGVITIDDAIIICALEGSIEIDPRFHVVKVSDDCNEGERCLCLTIINILWDTPHVIEHLISYEDCDGNIFTDVNVEGLPYVQICALPSSIVTNYSYSALSSGRTCIADCALGACYQYLAQNISEEDQVSFNYLSCEASQSVSIILEPLQSTTFCTSVALYTSSDPNLTITAIGNCG